MRLFVTGGAGFIGSHFVRTLLTDGYPDYPDAEVTVYDKLTYAGNLTNLAPIADDPRYTFIHGDILDSATLADVLPGHDAVINFAAESHVDRSITGATDFITTNALGVHTLLDACRHTHIPRILHVSTDEVYGSIDHGSFTETDRLDPNSPYAASKAAGDLIARSYAVTHGLNIVITRCTNNYGPYQHPEKLIPLAITNLIDNHPIPLYGDGLNIRDWLHVNDHCHAIATTLAHGRPGQIYNIGGGTELTNHDLINQLLTTTNNTWDTVTPVQDRKGHDRRYSLNDTKIRTELGYTPHTPFTQGLTHTINWYHHNPTWWRPLKTTPPA